MSKLGKILLYSVLIIIGLYFLVNGLMEAKAFLAPLVIAILLTMLVLPAARKFEKWGMQKGWAAFFSDLLIILFTFIFFIVISSQVQTFVEDWPKISKKIQPQLEKAEKYIEEQTGVNLGKRLDLEQLINPKDDPQKESKEEREQTANDKIVSGIASSAMNFFNFLGSMMLVFIYIFFFLLYRNKFEKSLLKIVPESQSEKTRDIVSNSASIAQQYLVGKFILILFLAVFYSAGLLIFDVKYAVFAGIIAAVLSLIPYIGNVIGGAIALSFAFLSGGIVSIIGVIAVFSVAQFIESYFLEPYVVGEKVELNPIIIIIIVVLGEAVWGIAGMVVAIPLSGIAKVVFDRIPVLKPYGYLLGDEDLSTGKSFIGKLVDRIKKKFRNGNQ